MKAEERARLVALEREVASLREHVAAIAGLREQVAALQARADEPPAPKARRMVRDEIGRLIPCPTP